MEGKKTEEGEKETKDRERKGRKRVFFDVVGVVLQ